MSGRTPIRPFMDYVERLEEANVQPEALDEIIHQLKSSEASDINNSGIEAQVEYILDCGAGEELDRVLKEVTNK